MSTLRVRPLVRRDLAEVVRIDAIHTGAEQRPYWTRLFRDFLSRGDGSHHVALGADDGPDLAGFLFADVRAFEFGSEPCGWILEVGVDPGRTRQGVATALLREAVRRLHGAGVTTVRAMVRRTDVPVQTFFRTNGFVAGPYVQLELVDDEALSERRVP